MAKQSPAVRIDYSNDLQGTIIHHLLSGFINPLAKKFTATLSCVTVKDKLKLEQMWKDEVRETIRKFMAPIGGEHDGKWITCEGIYQMGSGGSHIWMKKAEHGTKEMVHQFSFCFDSFY